MKVEICTFVFSVLILFPASLFALATEQFGAGTIDPHADWPKGTRETIVSADRVYSVWINGGEKFYYQGDADRFNKFLEKFAAIEIPIHRVDVRRARCVENLQKDRVTDFDWCLSVVSGITKAMLIREKGHDTPEIWPAVMLSGLSKNIDINDVNWPENVELTLPNKEESDILWLREMRCAKDSDEHLANVKFKIVDQATTEPLCDQQLNICRFVYFKLGPWQSSPYRDKNADWYIKSVTTDSNGVFILDLSKLDETSIVVQPPKPYVFAKFSRTSDLADKKSTDHVRVVHSGKPFVNRIYDLRRRTVLVIPSSGDTVEEPFTEILLEVREDDNLLYNPSRNSQEPTLKWVDEESGEELFDISDIVRFDWDRQIFELTRPAAMDLLAHLKGLYQKFTVVDDIGIIYQGTFVSPLASMTFHGPIIMMPFPDEKSIRPPLFKIQDGYHSTLRESESDMRFSERLKKTLEQADALGEIDVNNPPLPIESVSYGWFGQKDGMRVLIEVFRETLRIGRDLRVHIHLTGAEKSDENYVYDVNATLSSEDYKNKFSVHKVFSAQDSGWKNIYALEINPWKDPRGSIGRKIHGTVKLTLEVSMRKVLDERTETYSEPVDHVKADDIGIFIKPSRSLLPQKPQIAVLRFQKIVKDSEWEKALKYCAEDIKSKAKEYDSAEAFFKDVLPIDEITALSEFEVSGSSTRGSLENRTISYYCDIRLKVPDLAYSLEWPFSVLKKDSNWRVEFPTKPLAVWTKHEIMKYKAHNEGFKQDRQKLKDALRIILIPQDKSFIIGQPMLFDVKMQNDSNEIVMYHRTSWTVNNPMLVTGPDGAMVPYIDTDYQTRGGFEFIEPGETIELVNDYDVTSQYHIVRTGQYTFQFIGFPFHPQVHSNAVRVEVKPGQLPTLALITEKLLAVLPHGWILTRTQRPVKGDDVESDSPFVVVHMIGETGTKGKSRGIELMLFVGLPSGDVSKEWIKEGLKYWGQSDFGPIYVWAFDAEKLWPQYENDIRTALGIEQ